MFLSSPMDTAALLCFSHLRWNFVYQRPQHLLSRVALRRRVFYIEEPIFGSDRSSLEMRNEGENLVVVTPRLPADLDGETQTLLMANLLDSLLIEQDIDSFITWYYTPMALKFTRHLRPLVSVYDCMDQLSHFLGAPIEMTRLERELFQRVDVAFTGGHSLFEDKQDSHPNIHAVPSSVDVSHFGSCRHAQRDPRDQASILGPRIGFAGVIDERLDVGLVGRIAAMRPDWQLIMLGPVVKIDPMTLPQRPNIHYLGTKTYAELPSYISGWDVAMLPFARNDATKFISPTKTPEYLAAGCRTVSTSIRDVVRPYGELGLVAIADTPQDFVRAIDDALADRSGRAEWQLRVDRYLSSLSWDNTFRSMWTEVEIASAARETTFDSFPAPWKRAVRDRASASLYNRW